MHFVLPLVALCVPAVQRRAPQSPPSNVYKRGGGLGGLLGFGWVGASKPQNPPAPYKHSLKPSPGADVRCRLRQSGVLGFVCRSGAGGPPVLDVGGGGAKNTTRYSPFAGC